MYKSHVCLVFSRINNHFQIKSNQIFNQGESVRWGYYLGISPPGLILRDQSAGVNTCSVLFMYFKILASFQRAVITLYYKHDVACRYINKLMNILSIFTLNGIEIEQGSGIRVEQLSINLVVMNIYVDNEHRDTSTYKAWNFPCYFYILQHASAAKCRNNTKNSKL